MGYSCPQFPGEMLSAYVDGEVDHAQRQQVEQHLLACSACRATVESLRGLSAALSAVPPEAPGLGVQVGVARRVAMTDDAPRFSCARAQVWLSERLDGELPGEEAVALREHLSGCPACSAEAVALERMAYALRALPQVEPPLSLARDIRVAIAREQRWMLPRALREALFSPRLTPGMATAAATVMLITGFFLGRHTNAPLPNATPVAVTTKQPVIARDAVIDMPEKAAPAASAVSAPAAAPVPKRMVVARAPETRVPSARPQSEKRVVAPVRVARQKPDAPAKSVTPRPAASVPRAEHPATPTVAAAPEPVAVPRPLPEPAPMDPEPAPVTASVAPQSIMARVETTPPVIRAAHDSSVPSLRLSPSHEAEQVRRREMWSQKGQEDVLESARAALSGQAPRRYVGANILRWSFSD